MSYIQQLYKYFNQKPLKVTQLLCDFLLVFYSNYV